MSRHGEVPGPGVNGTKDEQDQKRAGGALTAPIALLKKAGRPLCVAERTRSYLMGPPQARGAARLPGWGAGSAHKPWGARTAANVGRWCWRVLRLRAQRHLR